MKAGGAILVRHGKNDKRRGVGMDQWGWELLRRWLAYRVQIPVGRLFCVIDGRTRGRPLTATSVRQQLRRIAAKGRCATALCAASAAPRACGRDGQGGSGAECHPAPTRHANLEITSVYLEGIDNAEIIDTVHARRVPMIPAGSGLRRSW